MKNAKRLLSLFLSVVMVLSVVSVGFTVGAVELDPIVLTKLERPTVSMTTSGMTRVSAGNGSFALGNVIVKATPSGVPENSGSKASDAYCGETPAATKIYFSSDRAVTDLAISCTSGSTNLVFSEPQTEDGVTVWEIVSGNANAGDYLEFTATYKCEGRNYASRCYSYVENIDNSAAVVFTVKAHNIMGTVYYAAVCAATRILGKGVKHYLSNYDGEYGYYDAGGNVWNTNKSSGYTGTYLSAMDQTTYSPIGGDSSYHDFAMNGIKSYTTVYVDTSVASSLADNNLRMTTFNSGIDYKYTKDNFRMFGTLIYNDERDTNMGYLSQPDNAAMQKIGYDSNGLDPSIKCPRGYTINTALFKGSVANLSENEMFTIMNYFRCEYPSASMNVDVVNKTLTPLYLRITLVDKGALRESIQTALNSEPTSPLVSNIYKGVNPQSWYYKSGFGNFKTALANACATLNNETATQDQIDSAQQSLDAMYSNLVLNLADYTEVNDLLEQADEIFADSAMYTAESINFLQEAYDSVVYNYNIFYQSAVDTMAGNIRKALDNMQYAGADYSVVETAIANADTSAVTSYVNSNASASFTLGEQTYAYYTDDFKAAVASGAQSVADAVDAVVYGLDVSRQDEVDAFAGAIDAAYAQFTALGADYTAVNALKAYAQSLNKNAANYTNFSAVRTAVNKVRSGYPVTRQSEVDGMAQDIITAVESLVLKAATKTPLETALALTPAYPQTSYTAESYAAWATLVAEGQAMMADETLTILDNQAIADKAAAITQAFNALALQTAEKTALETALALTPDYSEDYYTAESYSAWTTLVAEGQAMYDDDTLTSADNQAIADKASAITEAFNALTLKAADKSALETALALAPEYDEEYYTAESYSAWANLVTEGQTMMDDDALTILDNQSIADKATAITEAFNALTLKAADKTALATALALAPEYDEEYYTAESYSAWANLVTEGQAMMDDDTLTILDNQSIADKATAITEAFNALEKAGYTFEPAEGSDVVVDSDNHIIYGLEEGIDETALKELISCEGCEIVCTATDAGFGTGTKVEVVQNGEVVETFYIVIFGDVTGDGYIDAFDVALLCAVANYETEFEDGSAYAFAADLNGDEFVDSFDCAMLVSAANYETVIAQK
ncbi:MAG: dockerin type I repeat-containing protein [Clostridia bacterium]|nr:dockerin type I repeat-containing protein [Clostridia bacterium]